MMAALHPFLFPLNFFLMSLIITVVFGKYLAAVFDGKRTWLSPLLTPLERFLKAACGVSRETDEMSWAQYAGSLLVSNVLAGLMAFLIIRFQDLLPLNPLHLVGMEPLQAFNTACSFVTNTNWQSYSGEVSLSNFSQMLAVTFWMVVGATSGVVVCVAFLRGLTQRSMGNFYQDFIKALVHVFLPVMLLGSLFFISQGVPQTLTQRVEAKTLEGQSQSLAMGPVASLLTIKQFGTNGGGFFNANSAHPYENPNPLTDWVEIMLELALPMALVYQFGLWLKDRRQAWVIWGGMMGMFLLLWGVLYAFEAPGNPLFHQLGLNQPGGNLEGKELRFDLLHTTLFANSTTVTSTGAVNAMHDSLMPIAGGVPIINMMLNTVFGGVGVGLMGFLLYGVIAVFITGLMVGRTPEIFGKKIEKSEIILASIAILLHPILILVPTAISLISDFGLSSLNNAGPHGLSEILYAFTSAAANNGSAFAGLNANTPWYNVSIGLVILLGRYISIIALLAIAGSLYAKPFVHPGPGTLKTNTPLFGAVWVGVMLVISALTFVPVLALGPVAEHLAMLGGQKF